jgi:eukaryotic-like serine/threonine-protein kinase
VAVKPGDILSSQRSQYRVDALIGRGGMGHVFAATDLAAPASKIAVKVVGRVVFDETLKVRLHREAEAAARIRSEYVPRVLEVSDTEDGEMFLVMERLVGEPLSQRMRDRGPLPWSDVAQIGEHVLRGLIDAHTAGVVHRDLKPSNVFLATKDGHTRAMVLDFGVCKLDTVDTERLTGTGESIGTVAYMAPEQIRGASKVDDRADLYAFGVLVFEMVCARLPHDGPSQMAILASKLEEEPARLRDCSRTPTPQGLDELVEKALTRDPDQRFGSAQELLKAWRRLGAAELVSALRESAPGFRSGPHDAPTTVNLEPGREPSAEELIPVEPHPTQTALTQGVISLRKGGSGRVAFGLAACALAAGVVTVAAFFARGPDAVQAGPSASAPASSVGAAAFLGEAPALPPPDAPSPVVTAEPPATRSFELDGDPTAESPTASAAPAAAPRRSAPRARPRPTAAPRPSGPHITSQPRY